MAEMNFLLLPPSEYWNSRASQSHTFILYIYIYISVGRKNSVHHPLRPWLIESGGSRVRKRNVQCEVTLAVCCLDSRHTHSFPAACRNKCSGLLLDLDSELEDALAVLGLIFIDTSCWLSDECRVPTSAGWLAHILHIS